MGLTFEAVHAVKTLDCRALLKLLEKHPALVHDARSEKGHTLLEVALLSAIDCLPVSEEAVYVITSLLQHQPDVNVSSDGRTPLHLACLTQHEGIVNMLLYADADANATYQDDTPLHVAAKLGSIEIMQRLIETNNINVNATDKHGLTPLHYAVKMGRTELIVNLLTSGAIVDAADGDAVRSSAPGVKAKRAYLVQELLERGVDISSICDGFPATDIAARGSRETTSKPAIAAVNKRSTRSVNASLGTGRFGAVKLDVLDGETVVVKTLFASSPNLASELRALATTTSSYIVGVRKIKRSPTGGQWQLFLEYMDGGTLRSHLRNSNINILKVARAIARGLEALHEPKRHHGQKMWHLIHGNLKLDNVYFNKKGEIKLADFGLCRVESAILTHINLSTEHYVAPEVFEGAKISTSADIYAFGVILAEVDMRAPAPRGSDEKARQGQYVPEMRSDCDEWYRDLVQWCVAKDPKDRPKIDDVIEILDNPSMETINAVKVAREQKNIELAKLQVMWRFPLKRS